MILLLQSKSELYTNSSTVVQRPSENQRKVVVLRQTKPVECFSGSNQRLWWYGGTVPLSTRQRRERYIHNRPADCLGESDQRWCENVVQQDAGQTQV